MEIGKKETKDIDVSLLKEAPYNVAGRTTDDDIQWLAKDIAERGILQNLTVVEPEGEDGKYEIVCGNRRAKAAKIAGKRVVRCDVISKDTPMSERRVTNLAENFHRKDLSYQDQYVYIAEILKAYNDNVTLVALKVSWPEVRVVELLKYGSLSQRIKETIKSPEDFKNAMSAIDLSEDRAMELMKVAREKGLSNKTVSNIAESMKNDPKLRPGEAAERVKSRGTKISITLDGEWNEALTAAVLRIDTSRQRYAEDALKRRLVADGYGPKVTAV